MGAIGMIAMSIIAPMAAMIIQMAVSQLTRIPGRCHWRTALPAAPKDWPELWKNWAAYSRRIPMDANPSTAHMFIVNPLSGKSLQSLFSTHPPVEERISRLLGARPASGSSAPPPPPPGGNRQETAGRAFWDNLKGE
jgi:heat shock protein HtpX